jgi:nucleotide-binding universal stress UspA family protein
VTSIERTRTAADEVDQRPATERVVVGVTDSPSSVAALKWGARLAADHGWPLEVVAAWPDPAHEFVHAVPGHHCYPLEYAVQSLEAAIDLTRDVTDPHVADHAPPLSQHIENAHATDALLRHCDDRTVLVLGAAGTPWREGLPPAGVADACARLAPCPVVVVDTDSPLSSKGPTMNAQTTHWTVDLYLSELDGVTHADARLRSGADTRLHATGTARFNTLDPLDVPEIGYEIAAGRALQQLAVALLRVADEDVASLADSRS